MRQWAAATAAHPTLPVETRTTATGRSETVAYRQPAVVRSEETTGTSRLYAEIQREVANNHLRRKQSLRSVYVFLEP